MKKFFLILISIGITGTTYSWDQMDLLQNRAQAIQGQIGTAHLQVMEEVPHGYLAYFTDPDGNTFIFFVKVSHAKGWVDDQWIFGQMKGIGLYHYTNTEGRNCTVYALKWLKDLL